MVWLALALADGPTISSVVDELPKSESRTVCDLQLMGDGRALPASDSCTDALVNAAIGAFEPDPTQAVGMWPHPAWVVVDNVELQQVRVVSGRRGARVRPLPAARVQRWSTAQASGPLSVVACDVDVLVAENGEVEAAEPVDCPVQAEVVSAAMAWQFQPLWVNGRAVAFEASIVVPVASVDLSDDVNNDIEGFEFQPSF